MKSKINRDYQPELKGVLLGTIVLITLSLIDVFPKLLPQNNAWLAGLLCIAVIVVIFVLIMYKRVTNLKRHTKNDNV
jgi:hypothetical protein